MKDIELNFKDQKRWNDAYGRANLDKVEKRPEEYIIDPTKIAKPKLDMIKAMHNIDGRRILEFGSGRGEFSVVLAKRGGIVTGIDIGENLVKLAKKIAEINEVECKFIVASIDQVPFEDNTFDFVVGNGILHHLPHHGVINSLKEAYRVLKPGRMAFFTEPIENSKIFDFIQNFFPIGHPDTPQYRPSILQRKKWKKYVQIADDRNLSNKELVDAKGDFKQVYLIHYYGLLTRLGNLFPNSGLKAILRNIDLLLTHKFSPFKKFSQSVLVAYVK